MTALGKLFRTTAFKLTIAYLAVFALVSMLVLGYVVWNARALVTAQIREQVDNEAAGLEALSRDAGVRQLAVTVRDRAAQPNALLYLLTTPIGEPITGNVGDLPAGALLDATAAEVAYRRADDTAEIDRNAYVRVVKLPSGFRLLVGRDLGERERIAEILGRAILGALAMVVVLGLIGGFVVSRRMLRRVDAVTATSRTIMAGDLSGRLPVSPAGDEFDRLAAAANAMLDRIAVLLAGLKEVSDNIAHDLKTPLTRLRNRAEEALRGDRSLEDHRAALESVIEESDGLIRIFDALLLIARAESGSASEHLVAVDAGELVEGVAELYEPVAEEAGFALAAEAPGGLAVQGNRELLGQALANLVDNALKYGVPPEGGERSVRLAAEAVAGWVRLVVADRGAGVPEAERQRVLERFVRLEASRSRPGSGLGLSLAAAVARLHGGELRLEDNAPGLRVVIELPRLAEAER